MAEVGVDLSQEFPKPLTDEFVRDGRRRDHDGLRRRLPDLPGQALRGLGARGSRRARTSRRCGGSATRSSARVRAPCSMTAPDARPDLGPPRPLAEGLATFALVFAGCGAIVADAVYDGALGHGRDRRWSSA